jgi:hypothetical protein
MQSIEFSLCGIARRMDYDDYYKIECQNNEYLITSGDEDLYDSSEYHDVVSVMAGSIYIPKELQNDIYQVIAGFIFSSHCDMTYGFCHYGPVKSNWHACIVNKPKFLKKGKCYLHNKESIEILKNGVEAQEYTYYGLPEWWDEYLAE